jgi:hypothetical protein
MAPGRHALPVLDLQMPADASRVRDRPVLQRNERLLADVLEVLEALAAAHGLSWEDIVSEASRKRGERGDFDNRTFLEYVDQAR